MYIVDVIHNKLTASLSVICLGESGLRSLYVGSLVLRKDFYLQNTARIQRFSDFELEGSQRVLLCLLQYEYKLDHFKTMARAICVRG